MKKASLVVVIVVMLSQAVVAFAAFAAANRTFLPLVLHSEASTSVPTATETQIPPTATETPVPPTETPTMTPWSWLRVAVKLTIDNICRF